MPAFSELAPVMVGFIVTLFGSVLIVITKRWHGVLTFDTLLGPQKFHETLTPRIGGLAVFVGLWMVVMATSQPTQNLLIVLGISGTPAFLAGLMEDLSKKAPVILRLFATVLSGLLFCLMTGYSVTQTEVYLIDDLIKLHFISFVFTALALGGLANAINLIDGFNGLASGVMIIMTSSFGIVAYMVEDYELVWFAAIIVAILLGFLLVNFPWGYIFLGDGGAYFAGFLLGSLAIMLPVRNQEISEWVCIMILAYPVLEIGHSIIRKTIRKGHRPTKPDKVHLHMLVYRTYARKLAKRLNNENLANAVTSMLLWAGTMTSLVFVFIIPYNREWALLAFALQIILYFTVYRRVALLRRHPIVRIPKSFTRKKRWEYQ